MNQLYFHSLVVICASRRHVIHSTKNDVT